MSYDSALVENRFIGNSIENDDQLSPIYGYQDQPLLSLEEAVEPIQVLIIGLFDHVTTAKERCHYPNEHNLSHDEAACVYLYTMEWGENSFYRILNGALRQQNRNILKPWFSFLKLFETALKKLPCGKENVWRGVRALLHNQFKKNDKQIWWSVTSCSMDIHVIQRFLTGEGTLFFIEALNARDITAYTRYPNEKEVILLPGINLRVVSDPMEHTSGLEIVHLREITHSEYSKPLPLSLTETKFTHRKKYSIVAAIILVLTGLVIGVTTGLLTRKSKPPDTFVSEVNLTIVSSTPQNPFSDNILSNDEFPCETARWNSIGITIAGGNGPGTAKNQITEPVAVFLDSNDTLFVVDMANARVMKWEKNASEGILVLGSNASGLQYANLQHPNDIVIDKEGTIFITDGTANSNLGRLIRQVKGEKATTLVSQSDVIWKLAMDAQQEHIYVGDTQKRQVIKYTKDGTNSTIVIGSERIVGDNDQRPVPISISIDHTGAIYLIDLTTGRVMKWAKDPKDRKIILEGAYRPSKILINRLGTTLFVVDYLNDAVFRMNINHPNSVLPIAGNRGEGNAADQLHDPTGLAFDRSGNMYVTDTRNSRVQMFAIEMNSCHNHRH